MNNRDNNKNLLSKPEKRIDIATAAAICATIDVASLSIDAQLALNTLIWHVRQKAIKKNLPTMPFKILASALPRKEEPRQYLNYIYSNGRELTSSDGSRLLVLYEHLLEGFYDREGNLLPVDSTLKYFNFTEILNRETVWECPIDNYVPQSLVKNVRKTGNRLKVACIYMGVTTVALDESLVAWAKKLGASTFKFTDQVAKFSIPNGFGVIAPLNLPKD